MQIFQRLLLEERLRRRRWWGVDCGAIVSHWSIIRTHLIRVATQPTFPSRGRLSYFAEIRHIHRRQANSGINFFVYKALCRERPMCRSSEAHAGASLQNVRRNQMKKICRGHSRMSRIPGGSWTAPTANKQSIMNGDFWWNFLYTIMTHKV